MQEVSAGAMQGCLSVDRQGPSIGQTGPGQGLGKSVVVAGLWLGSCCMGSDWAGPGQGLCKCWIEGKANLPQSIFMRSSSLSYCLFRLASAGDHLQYRVNLVLSGNQKSGK